MSLLLSATLTLGLFATPITSHASTPNQNIGSVVTGDKSPYKIQTPYFDRKSSFQMISGFKYPFTVKTPTGNYKRMYRLTSVKKRIIDNNVYFYFSYQFNTKNGGNSYLNLMETPKGLYKVSYKGATKTKKATLSKTLLISYPLSKTNAKHYYDYTMDDISYWDLYKTTIKSKGKSTIYWFSLGGGLVKEKIVDSKTGKTLMETFYEGFTSYDNGYYVFKDYEKSYKELVKQITGQDITLKYEQ